MSWYRCSASYSRASSCSSSTARSRVVATVVCPVLACLAVVHAEHDAQPQPVFARPTLRVDRQHVALAGLADDLDHRLRLGPLVEHGCRGAGADRRLQLRSAPRCAARRRRRCRNGSCCVPRRRKPQEAKPPDTSSAAASPARRGRSTPAPPTGRRRAGAQTTTLTSFPAPRPRAHGLPATNFCTRRVGQAAASIACLSAAAGTRTEPRSLPLTCTTSSISSCRSAASSAAGQRRVEQVAVDGGKAELLPQCVRDVRRDRIQHAQQDA